MSGRARPPSRRSGYVLIELVVVLALIGLLLAIALPDVPARTNAMRLSALVTETATLLRDMRSEAIGHGRTTAVVFDAGVRVLSGDARSVRLPPDVDFAMTASAACGTADGRPRILFRADGTSCGALLRFAAEARVLRLRVDWVTGHVETIAGT